MSVTGYEAKNNKGKGHLCKECSKGLNISNLSEVKSTEYRDVYCVNCHQNLNGGGKKKPKNLHERLCCVLDEILPVYPTLQLAPGEEKEEKEISKGVKKVDHPNDAEEQVYIEAFSDNVKIVKESLNKLSRRGNLRFNKQKRGETIIFTIVSS